MTCLCHRHWVLFYHWPLRSDQETTLRKDHLLNADSQHHPASSCEPRASTYLHKDILEPRDPSVRKLTHAKSRYTEVHEAFAIKCTVLLITSVIVIENQTWTWFLVHGADWQPLTLPLVLQPQTWKLANKYFLFTSSTSRNPLRTIVPWFRIMYTNPSIWISCIAILSVQMGWGLWRVHTARF